MVSDEEIDQVLALEGDLGLKTEHLVDMAKKAGGKDNITVVLAEIG
jgi:serine/threonine protein phosphatase PrpC